MADQFQKLTDRELLQVYDYVKANPNESPLLEKLQPDEASRLGLLTNGEFQVPEGPGALSRFASNAADVLNPVSLAKGLYGAVRHPVETVQNIAGQQAEQFNQARELFGEGRYTEAFGHGLASAVPVLGPAAAEAGEQIASGDVAGGLGKGAGLLVPAAAPSAIRAGIGAARRAAPAGVREAAASALEQSAASRVAEVMAPTVGPNKLRFGNQAQKVAPGIAKDLAKADRAPLSREGLRATVTDKLDEAAQQLDAASDARLASQQVETAPILQRIDDEIARLTAEPVQASRVPDVLGTEPLGRAVEPAPSAGQLDTLRQIRAEVAQLGPVAPYESVRRIRQAWDQAAKVKFMPSTAQDALKAQGGATAAVKGTGAMRDALAAADPATAAVNAQYSVYKAAKDALDATAEIERVRPKVGRQIMARLTGTIFGGQAAGAPGAAAGLLLGPTAETVASAGFTTKLATARLMTRLAGAIRAGDLQAVNSLTSQLKRLSAQGLTLEGRATSPSGSRTEPAPASGTP